MASHATDPCCIVGFKHEGNPQGSIDRVETHEAYISHTKDRSTKYGVIIFPDFMGYDLNNVKLIADQFSANGYFTVIPDVWEGDNVPVDWESSSSFDLGAWASKHGPDKVEPIIATTIEAMRNEYKVEQMGAVGYCLGAKYVCRFLAQDKGFAAGYFAHPSATTNDEMKGVSGPLSIAAAENDHMFPTPKRHETEAILKEQDVPYQVSLYGATEHGFALKGDVTKKLGRVATELAFLQAVNWFDKFVKKG